MPAHAVSAVVRRAVAAVGALLLLGATVPVAHADDRLPPPVLKAQNAHADLGFDGLLHQVSDLHVTVPGGVPLRIKLPLRRVADADPDHWQLLTHERLSLTDTGEPVPFTTQRDGDDTLLVVARPQHPGERVLSLRWDTRGAADARRVTWLLPTVPEPTVGVRMQASLSGPGPVRDVRCTTRALSREPLPCDEVRDQGQSSAFGSSETSAATSMALVVEFDEGVLNGDTRQLVERLTWRTWWRHWWPAVGAGILALGVGAYLLGRRRRG